MFYKLQSELSPLTPILIYFSVSTDEADEITLANDDDLRIFVQFNEPGSPLQIFVRITDPDPSEPVVKETISSASASTTTQQPSTTNGKFSTPFKPV